MIGDKSKMKKKIVSCLMVCVVIVFAYFYAYIDKNSYIYDRNADTSTFYSTGILTEGEEVAQTFIAKEDTIDGFNIKVASVGNVENVIINHVILDGNSKQVCGGSTSASELENNKFNQLDVSQASVEKGEKYTIVLSAEGADEQNGVSFYIEPSGYKEQKLSINGAEMDGALVVRLICYRFDVETFVVLLGMIIFVIGFMKILYKLFR